MEATAEVSRLKAEVDHLRKILATKGASSKELTAVSKQAKATSGSLVSLFFSLLRSYHTPAWR